MPPFPVERPEETCLDALGIMLWDGSSQQYADLGALLDIQPTLEQGPDWMVWELADRAANGRPARRAVLQLRWLNNTANASTGYAVSKDGLWLVLQQTQEDLTGCSAD